MQRIRRGVTVIPSALNAKNKGPLRITNNEEMAIQEQREQANDVDRAILMLLGHRYGDGLVYMRSDREQQLFHEAGDWAWSAPGAM